MATNQADPSSQGHQASQGGHISQESSNLRSNPPASGSLSGQVGMDSSSHSGASNGPGNVAPGVSSAQRRGRGFAGMDQDKQREIARKGGEAVSRNRAHMAEIGRKGGEARAEDEDVRSGALGRKGGEAVSRNRAHMAEIGRKGGESRGLAQRGGEQKRDSSTRETETSQ